MKISDVATFLVSDTMTVLGMIFCMVASCHFTLCEMRRPLLHPQRSQQKRRKRKKSPKPSKWLTGETERETALPLKRFETLLSHQARLITKKIDLYEGRGSSMHFVLLCGLLDRFLHRDSV